MKITLTKEELDNVLAYHKLASNHPCLICKKNCVECTQEVCSKYVEYCSKLNEFDNKFIFKVLTLPDIDKYLTLETKCDKIKREIFNLQEQLSNLRTEQLEIGSNIKVDMGDTTIGFNIYMGIEDMKETKEEN